MTWVRNFVILSIFFICVLVVSPSSASAADRYWVGGTGNWSDDDNHWATSSGGAPADGNVPTASDSAIFDANSNATAYTVTIDAAAVMLDLNFSAAPASGTITWAGSATMAISGSMTLLSGMTRTYTGAITFNATSTGKTLTFAGVTTASAVTFNGTGGGWTLQDEWSEASVNSTSITLTAGALDTNGQTVTCASIASANSNTRTLTLGASDITITGGGTTAWNFTTTTNLTFDAGTSTITLGGTAQQHMLPGGQTFNDVVFSGTGTGIKAIRISGGTFANLTRTGAANKTEVFNLPAGQTITVTGTLTLNGNSSVNRLLLRSFDSGNIAAPGTAYTLNAANVAITNTDIQDAIGAGAEIGTYPLSQDSLVTLVETLASRLRRPRQTIR